MITMSDDDEQADESVEKGLRERMENLHDEIDTFYEEEEERYEEDEE